MKAITEFLILTFVISIFISAFYVIYMISKKKQFPTIHFTKIEASENDIKQLETLANNAIKGVNGWMWLATLFTTIYYFTSFWSILLMLLNIVLMTYEGAKYLDFNIFLTCVSLLFTFMDLWLNSKEKSVRFNNHWFITSAIVKEYIVKFTEAKTFKELCEIITEFNNTIYEKNASNHFF